MQQHLTPSVYLDTIQQKCTKYSPKTENQEEMHRAPIAQMIPNSRTYKSHDKRTWITNCATESQAMTMFFCCACRYIQMVIEKTMLCIKWMNQMEMYHADLAMSGCSPRRLNMGVPNIKKGSRIVSVTTSTSHDFCKKTTIMWYCFAPQACPLRQCICSHVLRRINFSFAKIGKQAQQRERNERHIDENRLQFKRRNGLILLSHFFSGSPNTISFNRYNLGA